MYRQTTHGITITYTKFCLRLISINNCRRYLFLIKSFIDNNDIYLKYANDIHLFALVENIL